MGIATGEPASSLLQPFGAIPLATIADMSVTQFWPFVATGNETLWQKFCEAVSLPGLAFDGRFAPPSQRAKNQKDLESLLGF